MRTFGQLKKRFPPVVQKRMEGWSKANRDAFVILSSIRWGIVKDELQPCMIAFDQSMYGRPAVAAKAFQLWSATGECPYRHYVNGRLRRGYQPVRAVAFSEDADFYKSDCTVPSPHRLLNMLLGRASLKIGL